MSVENQDMYPDCPTVTRIIEVGGFTKPQLLKKLQQHSILMNESGERLFTDQRFTTSETRYCLETVELTVRDLCFPQGATSVQLFNRASELGLELCPLELGPHLRLQYLDQPEGYLGKPLRQHQAPYGSITIASKIFTEDEDFPKGFYLRRIDGVLWLRGYRAGRQHVWNPEDHFIFCQTNKPSRQA